MNRSKAPLVSLALPLYKSRRFLQVITDNFNTIEYPNLEFLISDRHCADDALDFLEARFGHDPRFRFFRAHDEINWIAHYNFLLDQAYGAYFFWMPHDDSYPPDYVSVLVRSLQEHPKALLAYGRVERLYEDGSRELSPKLPPFSDSEQWTGLLVLRLFLDGQLWQPMRGIFRREFVIANGLYLPQTRETKTADLVWVAALAMHGRFYLSSEVICGKRFYTTSTHVQWKPHSLRDTMTELAALHTMLVSTTSGLKDKIRGFSFISAWGMVRACGVMLRALNRHSSLHPYFQRLLCIVLSPRIRTG